MQIDVQNYDGNFYFEDEWYLFFGDNEEATQNIHYNEDKKFEDDNTTIKDKHKFCDGADDKFCAGKEQIHDDGKFDGDNKFCAGEERIYDQSKQKIQHDGEFDGERQKLLLDGKLFDGNEASLNFHCGDDNIYDGKTYDGEPSFYDEVDDGDVLNKGSVLDPSIDRLSGIDGEN